MVLFVFEGSKPENMLFSSLDSLFLHIGEQKIKCVFHTNIYQLYKEIDNMEGSQGEINTVAILKAWLSKKGDATLKSYDSDDFSEIYLFFDYDPHAAISSGQSIGELNKRIGQMLSLFSNETENGKLYISYPMSEAFRHTKELPDDNYHLYQVSLDDCNRFKQLSSAFSHYKNTDFVSIGRCHSESDLANVRRNWVLLSDQNITKANYICKGTKKHPQAKEDISQGAIFEKQVSKYILPERQIAILSAFPLFLFDYRDPQAIFAASGLSSL